MTSRAALSERLGIQPHEQIVFVHTGFRVAEPTRPRWGCQSAPYVTADKRFSAPWALPGQLDDYVAFSRALDEAGISNMVVNFDGRVAVNGAPL